MRCPPARTTAIAVVLLLAAACSSPTAPSPPVVAPPVVAPTPQTDPPPALGITCPSDAAGTSTTGAAVPVTFAAPTTSGGVAPVQVSCTHNSDSAFAVGATPVQCSATDSAAQTSACTFTVTITAAIPRLSRTRFLAFGDSFTAGEVALPTSARLNDGAPSVQLAVIPSVAYPTQLVSLLRARYTAQVSSLEVINSGVPGEWAEDGAKRLPGVMASTRPEVVLLLQGSNELGALGQPGVSRAWLALDIMAKEVRNRGARAIIATLPPTRPNGGRGIPIDLVTSLNTLIRRTAAGEGALLVDLYAGLVTDTPRYVGADGLHLTEAGYRRMAELFFEAIRGDLERR